MLSPVRKCLNHFHLRSLAFQAFVDVFQGYYKDGTNGTRDCRYFAPLFISLRLISLLHMLFSFSRDSIMFFFLFTVVFGCYGVLFAIAQPYKQVVYNKTDIVLIFVLVLFGVSHLFIASSQKIYIQCGPIFWVVQLLTLSLFSTYFTGLLSNLFCFVGRPRYSIQYMYDLSVCVHTYVCIYIHAYLYLCMLYNQWCSLPSACNIFHILRKILIIKSVTGIIIMARKWRLGRKMGKSRTKSRDIHMYITTYIVIR